MDKNFQIHIIETETMTIYLFLCTGSLLPFRFEHFTCVDAFHVLVLVLLSPLSIHMPIIEFLSCYKAIICALVESLTSYLHMGTMKILVL